MNKKGFTLIEVLIALAILAIALVAVIKVMGQSVHNTLVIKEKTAAHWVAMNVLARMQVGVIPLNQEDDLNGTERMLGEQWHWMVTFGDKSESYEGVTIQVSPQSSDKTKEKLMGFVRLHLKESAQ